MPQPVAYITRRIPSEAVDVLRAVAEVRQWDSDDPIPRHVLLREVKEADALFPMITERIDEEVLERAPRLKIVANMAVGYDNIDVPACTSHSVQVTNTPDVLTETSADLAFALLMSAARRIVQGDRYVRRGEWKIWGPLLHLTPDIHAATLGIVGLGRIGQAVARRALGFDMHVLYFSRTRRQDLEIELGYEYAELPGLLARSDFVSIHLALNEGTRHFFGAEQFKQMKGSAMLINTGRGPLVDQRALYEALRDGDIAGAALDVTDPEPISMDDPLLSLENCIITPHVGSASFGTRTRMATLAAKNIAAVLAGKPPLTPVNSLG
ncbi:MAG TPA: D-glycerate dehydrogenase [Chloroflexota bacterium]|nr:D-glycerate dehydrogenase [Chloroflexota bacterium]